jgi:hypothetical protein
MNSLPTIVGAEAFRILPRSEVDATPFALFRIKRDDCKRRLDQVACDAGQPWATGTLLPWNVTFTDPALDRDLSCKLFLASLLEATPVTHTPEPYAFRKRNPVDTVRHASSGGDSIQPGAKFACPRGRIPIGGYS